MSSTAQAPKGKAWWVQLQHDRAVSVGCQFYTYRPATSGHSAYLQQNPSFDEQAAKLRPSTSDAYTSTNRTAASSMCSPHNLCVMRPSTSAKLPPEKPLVADKETGLVPFPQLCHAQCPCPEAMTGHQCTADLSPAATILLQGGPLLQLTQAHLLLKQKQLDSL